MENISGKVVVITGGSSGMGEATARYLGALGGKVVIGARRVDRIEAIATDINAAGVLPFLPMSRNVTMSRRWSMLPFTPMDGSMC